MFKRVLLADDDEAVRALVKATLNDSKRWQIIEARNGLEALGLAKSEKPDLIILDVAMPYLNGFEVCRQLKDNPETRGIIILLITGFPKDEHLERVQQVGANGYLSKPFSVADLLIKVEEALEL